MAGCFSLDFGLDFCLASRSLARGLNLHRGSVDIWCTLLPGRSVFQKSLTTSPTILLLAERLELQGGSGNAASSCSAAVARDGRGVNLGTGGVSAPFDSGRRFPIGGGGVRPVCLARRMGPIVPRDMMLILRLGLKQQLGCT